VDRRKFGASGEASSGADSAMRWRSKNGIASATASRIRAAASWMAARPVMSADEPRGADDALVGDGLTGRPLVARPLAPLAARGEDLQEEGVVEAVAAGGVPEREHVVGERGRERRLLHDEVHGDELAPRADPAERLGGPRVSQLGRQQLEEPVRVGRGDEGARHVRVRRVGEPHRLDLAAIDVEPGRDRRLAGPAAELAARLRDAPPNHLAERALAAREAARATERAAEESHARERGGLAVEVGEEAVRDGEALGELVVLEPGERPRHAYRLRRRAGSGRGELDRLLHLAALDEPLGRERRRSPQEEAGEVEQRPEGRERGLERLRLLRPLAAQLDAQGRRIARESARCFGREELEVRVGRHERPGEVGREAELERPPLRPEAVARRTTAGPNGRM
jgi:hypothetical protein